jgi:PncC family amidohydrolase
MDRVEDHGGYVPLNSGMGGGRNRGRDLGKGLTQQVQELCLHSGLTLAVAESCTGGLLGGGLTALSGSSGYFLGGVIAYSNRLKSEVLNVPVPLLESEGAVSEAVAQAMAKGVCVVTGADCGISVTGIAGPTGGTPEKPVGTVWVGIHAPSGTHSRLYNFSGTSNPGGFRAISGGCWLNAEHRTRNTEYGQDRRSVSRPLPRFDSGRSRRKAAKKVKTV